MTFGEQRSFVETVKKIKGRFKIKCGACHVTEAFEEYNFR